MHSKSQIDSTLTQLALSCVLGVIVSISPTLNAADRVTITSTPDGGIQPQVVTDERGDVHLLYYKGPADSGDIFYSKKKADGATFSSPLRVNSNPGSVMAVGSIRGAHLAIGKNQRPHVAWDGLGKGSQKVSVREGKTSEPFLYTRLNDAGTAFEPERNLITQAFGLDGGGSVSADLAGNVYAVWHASIPGNTNGESGRAVFLARSADEGKTFQAEAPATTQPTGACGCCGLKAFSDRSGATYILYRAATERTDRSEILLVSPQPGAAFQISHKHPWTIAACPMSSAGLSQGDNRVLAAWETSGQVYFSSIHSPDHRVSTPAAPPGTGKRKHPIAVSNKQGDVLMVWTEGTGWARGGSVAWQIFDAEGRPTSEKGRAEGVPVWGLVAAYANPDGSFVIIR